MSRGRSEVSKGGGWRCELAMQVETLTSSRGLLGRRWDKVKTKGGRSRPDVLTTNVERRRDLDE